MSTNYKLHRPKHAPAPPRTQPAMVGWFGLALFLLGLLLLALWAVVSNYADDITLLFIKWGLL